MRETGRRGGVGDGDGGGRGVGETTAATGGPHLSLWGGGDGCREQSPSSPSTEDEEEWGDTG